MKLRTFLVKSIDFYQKRISFLKKPSCVFYPTCSEYAKQALKKHGVVYGTYLGLRRIFRCHPWQENHMDPVP